MKVKDYEYIPDIDDEDEVEITTERKEILISKLKDKIVREHIALYQILDIGNNNQEINFCYKWLREKGIQINGIDISLSGEIVKYNHIPKIRQSIIPKKLIPREQQEEYFKKIEQGDIKARNEFIEGNWRLATWVANWSVFNKLNIPLKDKNQMAMIGLIKAVDNFNYRLGYAFSTYAVKVIFGAIIRQYRNEHEFTGDISTRLKEIEDLDEIENIHLMTTGKEATDEDIAHELGISLRSVKQIKENREKFYEKLSYESLLNRDNEGTNEEILLNIDETARGVNTEGGYIVDGVYLEEEPNQFFEDVVINADLEAEAGIFYKMMKEAMETLTEREQKILRLRFGFDGKDAKSLKEVGRILNLTDDRIRQIELKALRKLRYPTRGGKLKEFLEGSYETRIQGEEEFFTGLDKTIGIGSLEEELKAREQRRKTKKEDMLRKQETDINNNELGGNSEVTDLKDQEVTEATTEIDSQEQRHKMQKTRNLLNELETINNELINAITNIKDENEKRQAIKRLKEKIKRIMEEQQQ